MVHGESRLIHGMAYRISYRIDMFLLECNCDCVKGIACALRWE